MSATVDKTTSPTPLPYFVGRTLDLKASDGREIQAVVLSIYSLTMSPVMEVCVKHDGEDYKAVLKLYDRRFGSNRRSIYDNTIKPHTFQSEAAWKHYISSGMAETLLKQLRYDDDSRKPAFVDTDENDDDDDDDDDDRPESELEELGELECTAYYYTRRQYTTEVQAYDDLRALQGHSVPEFITSVTFDSISIPDGFPPSFFQVPGILIQYVSGFPLSELTSRIPNNVPLWEELIQMAVDLTVKVNKEGVFHYDCQARNFLVKDVGEHEFRIYMLDLASCGFRADFLDTLDEEDEKGYKWQLKRGFNGEEIACIMGGIVFRAVGHRVRVRLPFEEKLTELITGGPSRG